MTITASCYICGNVRSGSALHRWRKLIHDDDGNLAGVDMPFCAQSEECLAFANADRLGRLTVEQVRTQRARDRLRARRQAQMDRNQAQVLARDAAARTLAEEVLKR